MARRRRQPAHALAPRRPARYPRPWYLAPRAFGTNKSAAKRHCHLSIKMAPLILAVLATWLTTTYARIPPKKPNILFIVSDDLRPTLGTYGTQAITPNIDALAQKSLTFTRAYTQFPWCGPSRQSFMSGRYRLAFIRPSHLDASHLDASHRLINWQIPRQHQGMDLHQLLPGCHSTSHLPQRTLSSPRLVRHLCGKDLPRPKLCPRGPRLLPGQCHVG